MASVKIKQRKTIKLSLSEEEASELYVLLGESSKTSDRIWEIFDTLGEVL